MQQFCKLYQGIVDNNKGEQKLFLIIYFSMQTKIVLQLEQTDH